MKRRTLLGAAIAAAAFGFGSVAVAEDGPIKIGMSMAQTGGLAAAGKSSLLGIQIWRDDINAKGGLLGRKVELVVYDDKSSAAETPAIYAKLLDVDKVDLIVSGYATNMVAPAMPLAIQRNLLFFSLFSLALNEEFHYPRYFSMIPFGPTPKKTGIETRRTKYGSRA